jgi:V-type H+-transporting ATPase subunit a
MLAKIQKCGHGSSWKEKAIYNSLSMFKTNVTGMLHGEGWVISSSLSDAKDAMNSAHTNMDLKNFKPS